MLKAVLLDIDGTLVDSNDQHARAWERALNEFGYRVAFERIRQWIGMGGDKILPRVSPELDDRSEPGKSISRRRGEIFMTDFLADLKPTPGARALLERFAAMRLARVAATSAKREELDAILKAANLDDEIDQATTSDDAERSKPDVDIIEIALTRAKAAAAEAIYLGDTPYDVEAAHRAGMLAVALRTGGWDDAKLSAADAIYDTPADLLAHIEESPFARVNER